MTQKVGDTITLFYIWPDNCSRELLERLFEQERLHIERRDSMKLGPLRDFEEGTATEIGGEDEKQRRAARMRCTIEAIE